MTKCPSKLGVGGRGNESIDSNTALWDVWWQLKLGLAKLDSMTLKFNILVSTSQLAAWSLVELVMQVLSLFTVMPQIIFVNDKTSTKIQILP